MMHLLACGPDQLLIDAYYTALLAMAIYDGKARWRCREMRLQYQFRLNSALLGAIAISSGAGQERANVIFEQFEFMIMIQTRT